MIINQQKFILVAQELNRLHAGVMSERPGEVEVVRQDLDALSHRVGLDLDLARRLDAESLELLTSSGGMADPIRCWLLGEMFFIAGRLSEREGDEAGRQRSDERALSLFRRVDPDRLPEALPHPGERISELAGRVD